MIIVIDSGLWISAIQFGGTPLDALNRCVEFDDIAFCARIDKEIVGIMQRKFGMPADAVSARLKSYLQHAVMIEITGEVSGVCRDPDDDCILECAVKAGAQFIITGDHDLLTLNEFRGIRILTAREYPDLPIQP